MKKFVNKVQEDFLFYCRHNKMEEIELILNSEDKQSIDISYDNYEATSAAIDLNNLSLVKLLFSHFEEDLRSNLQGCLNRAAHKGKLDIVKFLTNSNDLKKWPDPYCFNNNAIKLALENHHSDIATFLMFDPHIKNKRGQLVANFDYYSVFKKACYRDNTEVIDMFFNDDNLKISCDLNRLDELFFRTMISNKSMNAFKLLISDYGLQRSPAYITTKNEYENTGANQELQICEELEKLFVLRDLNYKLHDLPQNKIQIANNKKKI